MWSVETEQVEPGRVTSHWILKGSDSLTYGEFIDNLETDQRFREFFVNDLRQSSYAAYRWETPPVTRSTFSRNFEFVLLNCPQLDRPIDAQSFSDKFKQAENEGVIECSNISGDATMVIPCPIAESNECYGHLASFVRSAPESQVDELWQKVGYAMKHRLSTKPVWLSTAGMGVSWLHVRLDSRPKYYGHEPYRSA